jgi:hypothetical protein
VVPGFPNELNEEIFALCCFIFGTHERFVVPRAALEKAMVEGLEQAINSAS